MSRTLTFAQQIRLDELALSEPDMRVVGWHAGHIYRGPVVKHVDGRRQGISQTGKLFPMGLAPTGPPVAAA